MLKMIFQAFSYDDIDGLHTIPTNAMNDVLFVREIILMTESIFINTNKKPIIPMT